MHLKQKSLECKDVLYFDLQPHPMACTLRSVVTEWKQTLQGSYIERRMLSGDWLMWYRHFINHDKFCDFDLKVSEEVGVGMEQRKI